ncbi:16763_t:CDS:1, partial [Racocetra persica]
MTLEYFKQDPKQWSIKGFLRQYKGKDSFERTIDIYLRESLKMGQRMNQRRHK